LFKILTVYCRFLERSFYCTLPLPGGGGSSKLQPHNSNWTGQTGKFQIQLSSFRYCLSQPLASNTCFAYSSSKPRFSHRDYHAILRADTTRTVCRISQAASYCLKHTEESGFSSWQGRDSVFPPWPPDQLWTSPSFLHNT
jgi:hypothetical protein